jgi:putative spermidine/putrescine transport system substrate-binding protein
MKRSRSGAAVLAVLALVAASCGDDEPAAGDGATAEATASADSGDDTPATTTATTESVEETEESAVATTAAETTEEASELAESEVDYMWTPNPDVLAGAEGEVNIVAWPGYIESGETSPDADWVTPFTEMTECTVNVKLGATSDEMVQLMQSGEYDGVSASGDATNRLMAGGEVVPLDLAEFTSYDAIFDGLKDKPWNSLDGQPMGIPHGRGANVLFYNTEAFPEAPDSWSLMWEPGSVAEGSTSVYDSPIYIADAALWLMATQPDLGITNPYALDQTQFDAAIALLGEQKAITGQYWADFVVQAEAMADATVLAGTTWEVVGSYAQSLGAKVGTVKPKEGATGWSDTWMLSSQAANPNCMKLWMDWISSPWANAQATEYFGEAPSNREGCALTANPDHCTAFHAEDEAYWTDVWYWTTATEECLDGRTDVTCVPYTEWVNAWNELRS